MAMLAEPRRKQKWSVDPRNSAWSKDESKFGQKMLEKMGWSKGKGLGAQEQGSTEHVKVQLKNNTLGLGVSTNHEDNWIAHQDDFNQLLAELNDCHGTASAASSDGEKRKSFSLEEKSKSSKKRVHYMKFAKGKDLSCRSDTDLACIFGKREKVTKLPQEKTDSEPEKSESKSPSPTTEVELGNTVISSLSVNEYFAKRMAQLKKSYAKSTETVPETAEQCSEDTLENYSEDTKKKSKKKKRRKNENDYCPEEPEVVENLRDSNSLESTDCQGRRRKPKSKKGDKVLTVETLENHEEEVEDHDETLRKKKKKKKNKRKKELCEDRQADDVTSTPNEDIDTEQPKKKKKRKGDNTEA
ncbi:LOW QUALITY PROTEIN: PIN2/TERF1-interacting telomerase inhibitor 1 [Bufo bufo]|uniref:LOW QUALITY PROTEIN: PIN2/TERF1-interacting telomerase inhibitor 1 n=1 Tax=Bufo bufo TaxID=8384 RepID=UPI001ABEA595|nr:LOW QUALITY PROTEIN: PIN2/TERF1-interacting telomerase inhibitor 1 [Bufo bufo]